MTRSSIKTYSGETSYPVDIGGVRRDLPIVKVSPHLWIASDAELILGDVEFLSRAAELLSQKVARRRIDIILTAEAKSIALAYELSKRLNQDRFIVARKSLKAYMDEYVSQKVKSITTTYEQELVLAREEMAWLRSKRVCLLDDVVSTGATFKALEALVAKGGGSVACKAAIWREGPWYRDPSLVYLNSLPIFTDEKFPTSKL